MNPDYLWLTEGLEIISFFVGGPIVTLVIVYLAWRGKLPTFISQRYRVIGILAGMTGFSLFALARWMNADVRTGQYFFQLVCALASFPLLGVFMGCGFCEMLRMWRWHQNTKLKD